MLPHLVLIDDSEAILAFEQAVLSNHYAISTATDNGASVVRVVNTGRVVPPDQVDRLFLPFTRLDDRTRHDGFGLGLALVSSIATVHSGTVHATAGSTGGRRPTPASGFTAAPPASPTWHHKTGRPTPCSRMFSARSTSSR